MGEVVKSFNMLQEDTNLDQVISLLEAFRHFQDNQVKAVFELIDDPAFNDLIGRYQDLLIERQVDLRLNLFALISDYYRRETFHSDILGALLDPRSPHGERYKYLHLFLEFLAEKYSTENMVRVVPTNYNNVVVLREKGRIDILIHDVISKRAIIIENKINNAPDQPGQIPQYYEWLESKEITCDAVVYLVLNKGKKINDADWSVEQRKKIKPLLKTVVAYDEDKSDLLNGWIGKCQLLSPHIEVSFIFRQYGDLIKQLGSNIMNEQIMERFYKLMQEGDNYRNALSLKSMIDDLVTFRIRRIIEMFKENSKPFSTQGPWQTSAIFDGALWQDTSLSLGVNIEPKATGIYFFDRNYLEKRSTVDWAKPALQKMGIFEDYELSKDHLGYRKRTSFLFPSEEVQLYHYIEEFRQGLTKVIEIQSNVPGQGDA